MLNEKLQNGTLGCTDTQLGDGPLDGVRIDHVRAALIGWEQAGDGEIGVDDFVDYDIGCTGFADVGGEVGKELFQLTVVRRDQNIGCGRCAGPGFQCGDIQTARAVQTDAINGDAVIFCGHRNGRRVGAGCGVAVGE